MFRELVSSSVKNYALRGLINGSNRTFGLPDQPGVVLFITYGGMITSEGSDYIVTGQQVTMSIAPDVSSERPRAVILARPVDHLVFWAKKAVRKLYSLVSGSKA